MTTNVKTNCALHIYNIQVHAVHAASPVCVTTVAVNTSTVLSDFPLVVPGSTVN